MGLFNNHEASVSQLVGNERMCWGKPCEDDAPITAAPMPRKKESTKPVARSSAVAPITAAPMPRKKEKKKSRVVEGL